MREEGGDKVSKIRITANCFDDEFVIIQFGCELICMYCI